LTVYLNIALPYHYISVIIIFLIISGEMNSLSGTTQNCVAVTPLYLTYNLKYIELLKELK
jgi:hypothetical protein